MLKVNFHIYIKTKHGQSPVSTPTRETHMFLHVIIMQHMII